MKSRSNKEKWAPTLTIGIPAYNVESYLSDCIESLVADVSIASQVEILVIDDGSSDKTLAIANKFAELQTNITVISKKNGGHGSTINTALEKARGKYFKLLDGDDWLETSSLLKLLEHLETTDTDIVLTNYIEYYSNTKTTKPIHNYTNLDTGTVYNIESNTPFLEKGPLLATTTFKTSLYKESPFLIDEHCFYVDMEYNFFIYQRAKTLELLPVDLYMYRLEREGQSMQLESIKRNHLHHEKVTLRIAHELLSAQRLAQEKYKYLLNSLVAPMCRTHYQILIEHLASRQLFMEFDSKLKLHSKIYHYPLISGKIIVVHRVFHGYTIIFDSLLRKIGRSIHDRKK